MRETLFGFPVSYRDVTIKLHEYEYIAQYELVHDIFPVKLLEIPRLLIEKGLYRTTVEYNQFLLDHARNWETRAEIHLYSSHAMLELGDYDACLFYLRYVIMFSPPDGRSLGYPILYALSAMKMSGLELIDYLEDDHVDSIIHYLDFYYIARNYFERRIYDRAIKYYQHALDCLIESSLVFELSYIHQCIGDCHSYLGEVDLAISRYIKAILYDNDKMDAYQRNRPDPYGDYNEDPDYDMDDSDHRWMVQIDGMMYFSYGYD